MGRGVGEGAERVSSYVDYRFAWRGMVSWGVVFAKVAREFLKTATVKVVVGVDCG